MNLKIIHAIPICMDMKYVLEAESEFHRLESQSATYGYDFKEELANFLPKDPKTILDAGCGSGIVTRYLAERFPMAKIIGCDSSEIRVQQAKQVRNLPSNVTFQLHELTHMDMPDQSVDAIVCRYVIEHLSEIQQSQVFQEFFRCIRPGGTLCVVDFDGLLYNIFPQTPLVSQVLSEFQSLRPLDLWVGRKLPSMLLQAGFGAPDTRIQTCLFQGEDLKTEIEMVKTRFEQSFERVAPLFGGKKRFGAFCQEYTQCLERPEAVLFYNKFIVRSSRLKLTTLKRSTS